MGLCIPTGPKVFSWQGSPTDMLTRYDVILTSDTRPYSTSVLSLVVSSVVSAVREYNKINRLFAYPD